MKSWQRGHFYIGWNGTVYWFMIETKHFGLWIGEK